MTSATPPRRRQARGQRRMDLILDAAAQIFAEAGYESTTTNAIAARAGISPGSLYQFFPNKAAVAEALAARYVEHLGLVQDAASAADLAELPLAQVLNHFVDHLVAFNIANPALKALFARTDIPGQLTEATRPLSDAVLTMLGQLLATRAPHLSAQQVTRSTLVAVQVFGALIPPIAAAEGDERAALITELKNVLYRYLAPLEAHPRCT